MNKLYIVGIGPGSREYLTPIALNIITNADVLIGGKRNLEEYDYLHKETFTLDHGLSNAVLYIKDNIDIKKIVVLASGDTGIFSIAHYLDCNLSQYECEFIPGISSLQYFMAKLNLSWNDAKILSLHGVDNVNLISQLRMNSKIVLFTGGKWQGHTIAEYLRKYDGFIRMTVGENLSYPNEIIVTGTPSEISGMTFSDLSLVLLEVIRPIDSWPYLTGGIPDDQFIRDKVPMTKSEVRSVVMSKLRLKSDSLVVDIGSGSGSVTVECGLLASNGHVWGIEKNKLAYELTKSNVNKFNLDNVTVINGIAPEDLAGVPVPDNVFIGGSGGNIRDILRNYSGADKLVRVVIAAITLETLSESLNVIKELDVKNVDICQVSVARSKVAGEYHLMMGENPIYIVSGDLV